MAGWRRAPEEVSRAPLVWPLDADALEDLRWYLEDYLLAPFGVWEDRGPAVRGKLAGGGIRFSGRCSGRPGAVCYERARGQGPGGGVPVRGSGLLGLPWELMRDGAGPVALGRAGIARSLPVAGGAGTLEVPGGRLRVLMVISRPAGTEDVGYQMVARPLLERLNAVRGEVDLTVLRPPTFDALARVGAAGRGCRRAVPRGAFRRARGDARAVAGRRDCGGPSGDDGRSGEGVLAFERPGGGSDQVGASQVAAVLPRAGTGGGAERVPVRGGRQGAGSLGRHRAAAGAGARRWWRWPTACTRSRRRSSWPRSMSRCSPGTAWGRR